MCREVGCENESWLHLSFNLALGRGECSAVSLSTE